MIGGPALNGVEKKPAGLMTGQRKGKLQAVVSGDAFQSGTVRQGRKRSPEAPSAVGNKRLRESRLTYEVYEVHWGSVHLDA